MYYCVFFFWCFLALLSAVLLGMSFYTHIMLLPITCLFLLFLAISDYWQKKKQKTHLLKRGLDGWGYKDTPKILHRIVNVMFLIGVVGMICTFIYSSTLPDGGRVSCDETTQIIAEAACWYTPSTEPIFIYMFLFFSVIQIGLWYPFCWGKNSWIYRGDK